MQLSKPPVFKNIPFKSFSEISAETVQQAIARQKTGWTAGEIKVMKSVPEYCT
ncbi:MAG: hypothetical protein JWQ66_4198 [Mucilaginibacter sp.]|nr:hypothetical protein [Mucilaginibacter sp.]